MANTDLAVIQLLWDIINQKTGELGKVDFLPEKPAFDFLAPTEQPLPRSTPEEQGVHSGYIADFVRELMEDRALRMHQLLLIRHGHVIYEGGFDPYPAGLWHASYSMCKSFAGMATGLLIDEGKLRLEDRVIELLAKEWSSSIPNLLTVLRFRELTVRHLLTMSSGVAFNEAGAVSGNDWVKNYFESPVKFAPGSRFEYNSMNTLMLSAIVTKLTGKTMVRYLQEKLFVPMGIRKIFWETSPKGYTKGGWGLFITPEDAAKLGLLYLNGGRWNGKPLISEHWVAESTRTQIETGQPANPGYGYQLWPGEMHGSFVYNGMLGQNVYVWPALDTILVTNAGNEEVFQDGRMTRLVRRYFSKDTSFSAVPLPKDREAERRLAAVRRKAEGRESSALPIVCGGWKRESRRSAAGARAAREELLRRDFLRSLDGTEWQLDRSGVGLFPLILQVVHNNYTKGISRLAFHLENGELTLDITEGGQRHAIPVGFGRGRRVLLNMNGEDYLVGTKGRFGQNENGVPVITLQIAFIEEAAERELRILFPDREHIVLYWSEHPGDVLIAGLLEQITVGSGNTNPLVGQLLGMMNPDTLSRAIQSFIEPVVPAFYIPPAPVSEN
ncbi:serine hydrolase domain-containing protein [Lachnoclostridium sp. Marseille-P6806]|uniref:serine hydrolase domain-containing protein n=1 Tax=Lachnoclostridium sp. Marseille-P6806 TaxID=2364793 RepID=UPI0010310FA6|nr:serine hydrolase [Lachnoclostridium sp. Marseille-P6806]